ncbi:hypothetical protein OS493_006389 [Desmophyllum pertusum]|uniref:Uncharacterized protein n=1 Tax=Desmophyllum pertusum TaxID=174260 RepID=A0A9X0DBC8_9CNID|nr:hypothetical protein OS493_006389 [Desmophyllum pertusum]
MAAIRRVANHTGYFWFDTAAYHNNETAMVPHWVRPAPSNMPSASAMFPRRSMPGFEDVMDEFVREHLNKEYAEVVERVFPTWAAMWKSTSCAMVVLLIIAAAVLVYRVRLTKKKAEKELEPAEKELEPKKTGDVTA